VTARARSTWRALHVVTEEGKLKIVNMFRVLRARATLLPVDEAGMSTVEYSVV
jgi:hypothetical protein